jgi:hypothetical protein
LRPDIVDVVISGGFMRIVQIIVAVAMSLALFGCPDKSDAKPDPATATAASAAPNAPGAAAPKASAAPAAASAQGGNGW